MKILHVVPSMDPQKGGVCQAVKTLIAGLSQLDTHNEVVTLDAASSDFLSQHEFPVHALDRKEGAWMYSAGLIPWLNTNLTAYDSVVVHGMWNYHAHAVEKTIKNLRRKNGLTSLPKIFLMPHGMLDPYFQKASSRKIKALRNWLYWNLIEKKVVNNAEGLLFTCEEEQRLAREPFNSYRPKTQAVTGLGVEQPPAYEEKFRYAFYEKCKSQPTDYLLFLSRIHEKKGLDILVEAYGELYCEKKYDMPHLVIAGPGIDSSYGQQIQQLIKRYNLQEKIITPGMLTGDAKWGALYGASAFVLTSHQENFGIAIVEAMACSKPVIISNQINIWKEIENENAGLVCDDNVASIKIILQQWATLNANARQVKSRRARLCYEKYFSITPVASRMLKVLTN